MNAALEMVPGYGALPVVPPKYVPANDNDSYGAGLRGAAAVAREELASISDVKIGGKPTEHRTLYAWTGEGANTAVFFRSGQNTGAADGDNITLTTFAPLEQLLDPSTTSAPSALPMRLVILESPYAGNVEQNVEYARRCVRDSLMRGEAPIASHLLYTQPGILDDDVPAERAQGIDAGLAWRRVADASVVYVDFGISRGMQYGIEAAQKAGRPVEYRRLRDAGRVG